MSDPDPIKTIAHGGQPEWEEQFTHPVHGELTFKAKLPKGRQWMQQMVAKDNLLAGLAAGATPSQGTALYATAVTGLQHLMELPEIGEERIVADDGSGHEVVRKRFYDPLDDEETEFPVQVWTAFFMWRMEQFDRKEELKNSSGGTSGSDSSESSTATTVSPSTTPA